MAARAALQTIQIFNPYVNQGGSFNAYSYYDHGVETQENFRDVFPVTDQCERSAQLMGDDYVRLKFNLTAYVPIAAFSFIRYDGQTFFLMNDYCPHSNGSRKIYDGQGNAEVVSDSYEYDMKFYSVANMLRKPICYRHVKVAKGATAADGYHEWDEPEITVSATLPTMYVIIVQSIARYTTRLDSNLLLTQMLATIPTNGLDNTGIAPKNTVKLTADTELATFNFNGDNIADVCTTVANAYSDAKKETEWYIEEDANHSLTLHFCKCLDTQSMNHADDFSYKNTEGINRETHPVITGGLKKVDYSRDESNIPQVIIPYGSERNMTYQAVKGIDEVSQMQSTFGKRLRLKANHTCTINGTQYPTAAMQAKGITGAYAVKDKNNNLVPLGVDAHGGIANDQVNTGNEKVEYFDDVYPQCHFVVSKVEERSKKKDGNTIPEYTCEGIVVDAQGQIVQPEGDFYPLQIEEGKTLSVRFESGYLNGREFEIANKTQKKTNPSTGQPETNYTLRFVIVADGSIEDGTLIPSGNFKPRARVAGGYEGDKFALFNMKMPEAYITYAQEELAQKAYEKLIEYQDTVPDVKCTSDPDSFGGKDVYFGAQYTINSEKLGFTLNEQNRRVPVDFISRVVAYSYKLTKVNEVSFTLSSALVRGVLSEMAAAITNVSYATEGLGQRSINLSRRGWRDASEVADMITSMNTEMMLVGNEKYQFQYTSEILPLHTNGVFTGLKVSYGQLQHTQQPYIDYANDGLWQIQPNASLNADYQGNPLDGTKPYYVFAVCGTDNLEWATVILMDKDAAETNGVYHKDAEISDQDQYPEYLLLGILSSEFAEEKDGQMTYERVFSPTNGFTAIDGGTITTEQIQDANRQLIIDFQSNPPRIIAKRGAQIIGNITFISSDGSEKPLGSTIDTMNEEINKEIGGENLYTGVDPLRITKDSGSIGVPLEDGKKYVVSVQSVSGTATDGKVRVYEQTEDGEGIVTHTLIGTIEVAATGMSHTVVEGHGGELELRCSANMTDKYYDLSGIMVQQGEKPTTYQPTYKYLAEAFEHDATKQTTDVNGGLIATSLIKLRNLANQVMAGISGLNDGIVLWGGGSYADALSDAAGTTDILPVLLTTDPYGIGTKLGILKIKKDANHYPYLQVDDDGVPSIQLFKDRTASSVISELSPTTPFPAGSAQATDTVKIIGKFYEKYQYQGRKWYYEHYVNGSLVEETQSDWSRSTTETKVLLNKNMTLEASNYKFLSKVNFGASLGAHKQSTPSSGTYSGTAESSVTVRLTITNVYTNEVVGTHTFIGEPDTGRSYSYDIDIEKVFAIPSRGTYNIKLDAVVEAKCTAPGSYNTPGTDIEVYGEAQGFVTYQEGSLTNLSSRTVLCKDGFVYLCGGYNFTLRQDINSLDVRMVGLPETKPSTAGRLYTQTMTINGSSQKVICIS